MNNKLIAILFLILIFLGASISLAYAREIPKYAEKIEFIHYTDSVQISNRTAQNSKDRCYRIVKNKWNDLPVQLTLDLSAINSLDPLLVENEILNAAQTWNNSTSKGLFNTNLLEGNNLPYGENDGINSISFGYLRNKREIAKTTFWYSRKTKEIFDADIIFNTYYSWGDSTKDPNVMDIADITTHELGHVLGLKDIYLRSCSNVTMFGYSNIGETKKQTLEISDITAIEKLYG